MGQLQQVRDLGLGGAGLLGTLVESVVGGSHHHPELDWDQEHQPPILGLGIDRITPESLDQSRVSRENVRALRSSEERGSRGREFPESPVAPGTGGVDDEGRGEVMGSGRDRGRG